MAEEPPLPIKVQTELNNEWLEEVIFLGEEAENSQENMANSEHQLIEHDSTRDIVQATVVSQGAVSSEILPIKVTFGQADTQGDNETKFRYHVSMEERSVSSIQLEITEEKKTTNSWDCWGDRYISNSSGFRRIFKTGYEHFLTSKYSTWTSRRSPLTPRSGSPFTPRSGSPLTPRTGSPLTPRSGTPLTSRSRSSKPCTSRCSSRPPSKKYRKRRRSRDKSSRHKRKRQTYKSRRRSRRSPDRYSENSEYQHNRNENAHHMGPYLPPDPMGYQQPAFIPYYPPPMLAPYLPPRLFTPPTVFRPQYGQQDRRYPPNFPCTITRSEDLELTTPVVDSTTVDINTDNWS